MIGMFDDQSNGFGWISMDSVAHELDCGRTNYRRAALKRREHELYD
jgi:hypothetical protein